MSVARLRPLSGWSSGSEYARFIRDAFADLPTYVPVSLSVCVYLSVPNQSRFSFLFFIIIIIIVIIICCPVNRADFSGHASTPLVPNSYAQPHLRPILYHVPAARGPQD